MRYIFLRLCQKKLLDCALFWCSEICFLGLVEFSVEERASKDTRYYSCSPTQRIIAICRGFSWSGNWRSAESGWEFTQNYHSRQSFSPTTDWQPFANCLPSADWSRTASVARKANCHSFTVDKHQSESGNFPRIIDQFEVGKLCQFIFDYC